MAEDDHVPVNTEPMGLAEDIEAAQYVIMANVVLSGEGVRVKMDRTCGVAGSSSIEVAIHHVARTVGIYFYHLRLERPGLVPVSPAQLVWF